MFLFIKLFFLLLYGLIIGVIAKAIHPKAPDEQPVGLLGTIGIGIAGTYIGGLVNYMLGWGHLFGSSGVIMSIVGGVLFLIIWRWWNLNRQKRSFWTGRSFC